jgi:hypothetical protein
VVAKAVAQNLVGGILSPGTDKATKHVEARRVSKAVVGNILGDSLSHISGIIGLSLV